MHKKYNVQIKKKHIYDGNNYCIYFLLLSLFYFFS